jgi:hypothetical protein
MSIKKQLQKFYAKQGLQGKHLRKAIQWDMKAVKRNRTCSGAGLVGAFVWSESPECAPYWSARYC